MLVLPHRAVKADLYTPASNRFGGRAISLWPVNVLPTSVVLAQQGKKLSALGSVSRQLPTMESRHRAEPFHG
jgi:hypothetical protein